MRKLLLFFFGMGISLLSAAQDSTMTAEEKALLDSMFQNDEFLKMLGSDEKISFADINLGLSNGVFSIKNNSLNAGQAETNKIFYTAAASYNHKSGFSFGVKGFFATDAGKFKMYQSALSPSYNYANKKIMAGISYTRYIDGAVTSFNVNPYKNDFYGSFGLKKPWWKPSIAIGYSSGKYEEYYDSTFVINLNPPNPPRTVRITDTITSRIQNFSVTLSASHSWTFEKIFTKEDALELQPSVMLNMSNQQLDISHSNSIFNRRPIVQKLLKRAYGDGKNKIPFQVQSAALMLELSYDIGHFNFAPQLYADYYFPETTGNRLSFIYSFTASFAF